MGLLDRFRKKKKEETEIDVKTTRTVTELEQLCRDDKETYEALLNTMFLNPKKIDISIKEAFEKARTFEKAKDVLRAKVWYEIAGGLAIYEGDVKKVVECFSKCKDLAPNTRYSILKNPEKAVAKAQKYYKKYLQA